MALGTNIRIARKKALMTQVDLANKLGVKQHQITRWENDQAEPRLSTIKKIAEVTGTPLIDLITDDEETENERI